MTENECIEQIRDNVNKHDPYSMFGGDINGNRIIIDGEGDIDRVKRIFWDQIMRYLPNSFVASTIEPLHAGVNSVLIAKK